MVQLNQQIWNIPQLKFNVQAEIKVETDRYRQWYDATAYVTVQHYDGTQAALRYFNNNLYYISRPDGNIRRFGNS